MFIKKRGNSGGDGGEEKAGGGEGTRAGVRGEARTVAKEGIDAGAGARAEAGVE